MPPGDVAPSATMEQYRAVISEPPSTPLAPAVPFRSPGGPGTGLGPRVELMECAS